MQRHRQQSTGEDGRVLQNCVIFTIFYSFVSFFLLLIFNFKNCRGHTPTTETSN